MKRSELVQALLEDNPTLRQREVDAAVSTFFNDIADRIVANGRVELRGFGNFSTRLHNPRHWRRPKTGELVQVPYTRHAYFRAARPLLARLTPT